MAIYGAVPESEAKASQWVRELAASKQLDLKDDALQLMQEVRREENDWNSILLS